MSTLANLDKTLNRQLKDPVVSTVLRVVFVLYILMLSSVDRSVLALFENLYFQIFYFASLAYVAMVDPATAVLMAAAYLFSVQQLNRGNPSRQEAGNSYTDVPLVTRQPVYPTMESPSVMLPSTTTPSFMLPGTTPPEAFENADGADHPAFKTATENLFTNDAQFQDAQNNSLQGVDQNVGVKSLTNQFSSQGLDTPYGFTPDEYVGSPWN